MIKKLAFVMLTFALVPNMGYTACSRANLTRCLDSACAVNISSNPAARCQYCGTADAGEPNDAGMRAVSVGTSSRFTISSKELKNAPTDPGERYVWASKKCITMVDGCTADDVSETYDTLIEQSCTAAGISAQMSVLFEKARQTKTAATCKSEMSACIVESTKCTSKYSTCAEDSDFNHYFSECAVAATGCDEYLADIRTTLMGARDNAIQNAESSLLALVQSYRDAREKRLASIIQSCNDNSAREACITSICNRSMPNKCHVSYPSERSMATQLCKFYDMACSTLK
ncbi:MAG: hypothetical protein J6W40_04410 [Alphaproteobacteria bacterium]|nr:hypothetical protein [Alphaproteobacteria bacterium]